MFFIYSIEKRTTFRSCKKASWIHDLSLNNDPVRICAPSISPYICNIIHTGPLWNHCTCCTNANVASTTTHRCFSVRDSAPKAHRPDIQAQLIMAWPWHQGALTFANIHKGQVIWDMLIHKPAHGSESRIRSRYSNMSMNWALLLLYKRSYNHCSYTWKKDKNCNQMRIW